jgi:hypothetical protein
MRKYNFIRYSQATKNVEESISEYANFNGKNTSFVMSRAYVNNRLLENKFLRFFIEPENKCLGWKVLEGYQPIADVVEPDVKQVKEQKTTKRFQFSVGRLVASLGLRKELYKKMPINETKDSRLEGIISFVEFIKPEEPKLVDFPI